MSDIHFIITGGTIDSSYNPVNETAEPNEESVIPYYMRHKIKPHGEYSFEVVCLKDSSDITDGIREQIAQSVKKANSNVVIITHGTVTMAETAEFLNNHLDGTDKVVVLVGAMIPLKEFAMSDAGFNLGYAVAAAQNMESGVYVCMNAQVFNAGETVKDTKQARFVKR
ncbi:MAG TPA: asparaginase [Rhodospirillaceae bacterium]|nr:asparaginase [Rhodospirillaceae bacterium]